MKEFSGQKRVQSELDLRKVSSIYYDPWGLQQVPSTETIETLDERWHWVRGELG